MWLIDTSVKSSEARRPVVQAVTKRATEDNVVRPGKGTILLVGKRGSVTANVGPRLRVWFLDLLAATITITSAMPGETVV